MKKRKFPYITVGRVLDKINYELGENFKKINPNNNEEPPKLTRATFYRLEKRLNLPAPRKESGQLKWRIYTSRQEKQIISKIKKEFRLT